MSGEATRDRQRRTDRLTLAKHTSAGWVETEPIDNHRRAVGQGV